MFSSRSTRGVRRRRKSRFPFTSERLCELCVSYRSGRASHGEVDELCGDIYRICDVVVRSFPNVRDSDDLRQDAALYVLKYAVPKVDASRPQSATSYLLASASFAGSNTIARQKRMDKRRESDDATVQVAMEQEGDCPADWNCERWESFRDRVRAAIASSEDIDMFRQDADEIVERLKALLSEDKQGGLVCRK